MRGGEREVTCAWGLFREAPAESARWFNVEQAGMWTPSAQGARTAGTTDPAQVVSSASKTLVKPEDMDASAALCHMTLILSVLIGVQEPPCLV